MLNRTLPFGIIGGTHELGAAFEQHGRLYDSNGYEIDKVTGKLIDGPGIPAKKANAPRPTVAPAGVSEADLHAVFEGRAEILRDPSGKVFVSYKQTEPAPSAPPVGLSMQSLSSPPPPAPEEQDGQPQEPAPPDDIIRDGINLSAFARGQTPNVEFKRVQPIIAEIWGKKPVNISQALKIINGGLPQE